jgi:hypothetical protein
MEEESQDPIAAPGDGLRQLHDLTERVAELGTYLTSGALKAHQAVAGISNHLESMADPGASVAERGASLESAKRTLSILKAELGRDPSQARPGWAQLVASIGIAMEALDGTW